MTLSSQALRSKEIYTNFITIQRGTLRGETPKHVRRFKLRTKLRRCHIHYGFIPSHQFIGFWIRLRSYICMANETKSQMRASEVASPRQTWKDERKLSAQGIREIGTDSNKTAIELITRAVGPTQGDLNFWIIHVTDGIFCITCVPVSLLTSIDPATLKPEPHSYSVSSNNLLVGILTSSKPTITPIRLTTPNQGPLNFQSRIPYQQTLLSGAGAESKRHNVTSVNKQMR